MKFHLLIPLLALGMLASCSKKAASKPSAYALKPDDFPTFIANPGTLNIVNFSASWCPPCQQLKPVLESIAVEHAETVKLGVVDVDTGKKLADQQGVSGIPDVRFYIDGKLVDKFTGAAPKEEIEQLIAKHSKNLTPPEPEVTTPIPPAEPAPPAQPTAPTPPTASAPPVAPAQPISPAAPTPTILPSNGNPLPPGMSKQ